jgi:hypothetical protein
MYRIKFIVFFNSTNWPYFRTFGYETIYSNINRQAESYRISGGNFLNSPGICRGANEILFRRSFHCKDRWADPWRVIPLLHSYCDECSCGTKMEILGNYLEGPIGEYNSVWNVLC